MSNNTLVGYKVELDNHHITGIVFIRDYITLDKDKPALKALMTRYVTVTHNITEADICAIVCHPVNVIDIQFGL